MIKYPTEGNLKNMVRTHWLHKSNAISQVQHDQSFAVSTLPNMWQLGKVTGTTGASFICHEPIHGMDLEINEPAWRLEELRQHFAIHQPPMYCFLLHCIIDVPICSDCIII